jgi:hypothetical protein
MADKKCPKCNLWNSENAEVCDCGYNFVQKKVQLSIRKEEEYKKLLQKNEIKGTEIKVKNRDILIRVLLSLFLLYIANLPIPITINYYGCISSSISSSIALIFVIVINVFPNNDYASYVLRRIWKYPIIGIVLGFVIDSILILIIGSQPKILPNSNYISYGLADWHYYIFITIIFVFGLIGLCIAKKRVTDDMEKYSEILK